MLLYALNSVLETEFFMRVVHCSFDTQFTGHLELELATTVCYSFTISTAEAMCVLDSFKFCGPIEVIALMYEP